MGKNKGASSKRRRERKASRRLDEARENARHGGAATRRDAESDEIYDRVDRFAEQYGSVALNADDDTDEGDTHGGYEASAAPRSVLGLTYDEDDDENEEGGDGDEYEYEYDYDENDFGDADNFVDEAARASDSVDEPFRSEDDDDGADEEAMLKAWGRKRHTYYQDEERGVNEEEALRDELEEATMLQRRQRMAMRDEDFDVDELGGGLDGNSVANGGAAKKGRRSEKAEALAEMDEALDAVSFDSEEERGKRTKRTLDSVEKDLSTLSREQLLEIVDADAPELLQLLDELQESMVQVRDNLTPVLEKLENSKLPTARGMSFVEAKLHLLLNYTMNIVFYLLLKAKGEAVRDHPVIDQLVRLRVLLEKARPLDKKLKHQVDKYLKIASLGSLDAVTEALVDRPDARRLIPVDGGGGGGDNNVSEDARNEEDDAGASSSSEERPSKARTRRGAGSAAGDATVAPSDVYRPPRVAAMYFEDERREKEKMRAQERASKSNMYEFLRNEFGSAPVQVEHVDGGAYTRTKRDNKANGERQRFEEENFVRLLSAKSQKGNAAQPRLLNELRDLEKFGDLAAATDADDDVNRAKRAVLAQFADSIERRSTKGRAVRPADEDLPYESAAARRERKRAHTDVAFAVDEEDDAFDNEGESKRRAKKRVRVETSADDDAGYGAAAHGSADADQEVVDTPVVYRGKLDVGENERRKLSKLAEKNRGLVRSRGKTRKTTRSKLKNQFSRAEKKQRGQVIPIREKSAVYGGERTGIKTTVKRSVDLR